jgi:hypothetical protein
MLVLLLSEGVTNTRTVIKETIPLSFYIPVLVSILTAAVAAYATIRNTRVTTQTQREMATLAERTAREFKDKDYKNDFYKKIIDKRLSAWEQAEIFLEMISTSRKVMVTEHKFYSFFLSKDEFYKVQSAMVTLNAKSFWLNKKYRDALIAFSNKLNAIINESDGVGTDNHSIKATMVALDEAKLIQAGIKYYPEMNLLIRDIMESQAAMISTLYDIELFLAENKNSIYPN